MSSVHAHALKKATWLNAIRPSVHGVQFLTPPASHCHMNSIDTNLWISLAAKLTLLSITAVSVHVSLSPPNPPVKSEECCSGTKETDTIFEKFVHSITYCSKVRFTLRDILFFF